VKTEKHVPKYFYHLAIALTLAWTPKPYNLTSNRSGRSSKLSDSDVCYLKILSDTPLAEITRDGGLIVSEDTLRRVLREKGYYMHIVRKKPFLTKRKKIN
jgi:hypothetical protein